MHTYRFLRNGEPFYEGAIVSLKHENEFVAEASSNTEVGIQLASKEARFKPDDVIEAYEEVTVQRYVNWQPLGF